jgi:hypothetical protein
VNILGSFVGLAKYKTRQTKSLFYVGAGNIRCIQAYSTSLDLGLTQIMVDGDDDTVNHEQTVQQTLKSKDATMHSNHNEHAAAQQIKMTLPLAPGPWQSVTIKSLGPGL